MTQRERQILNWIEADPMISQQELADRAGITRSSVAVHISNLMKKGCITGKGYIVRTAPYVAVVGGVNMDIGAVSAGKLVARDSNPGHVTTSLGGVGRNIAENLCRLGKRVLMVTAVGEDAHAQQIQQSCRELGIGCDIIPQVTLDGITVSSTYIRQLVESGDVERAAHFLGHRHCMTQTVGHGQRIGRTIGIPTVNLAVPGHVLVPKHGVYVSRVYLPGGKSYAGVTNVGTRPTVSDSCTVSVETFLLDFQGDLYGQRIRLEYCRRLRDEEKFGSLEQLRDMIRKNIEQTRAYFRESCIE